MGTLVIRDVDEKTKQRVRRRAARSGHSMSREAREILERELAPEGAGEPDQPEGGEQVHTVEQILRRMRPLGEVDLPEIPREPIPPPPTFDE